MIEVKIDRANQAPLHEQVAAELRAAIANGEAQPGDRLPPARDFATYLGVNRNTVFRAFHVLREEGVLEFQRGRGITVAGMPEKGIVLARAREFVRFARLHGYRHDDLVQLIDQIA